MKARDFPDRFRDALRARLKAERGAGEVEADIRALKGGEELYDERGELLT